MGRRRNIVITSTLVLLSLAIPSVWFACIGDADGWVMGAKPPAPLQQNASHFEQMQAVGAFFGVKTLYTVLTAWLLVRLWKSKGPDLVALWWGLAAFFVGEAFCFVNVMWFGDLSAPLEFFHGAGMVVFLAFLVYALITGVGERFLRFAGDGPCALAPLCSSCTLRQSAGPCHMRRLALLVTVCAAVMALAPLCWMPRYGAITTMIFGKPHTYTHPVIIQFYEWFFLPLAALAMFGVAFVTLLASRVPDQVSALFFSAGCGAAGFSLLRLCLVGVFFEHQVWFAVWEEVTELLLIGAIAWVLWTFPGLLRAAPAASPAQAMAKEPA